MNTPAHLIIAAAAFARPHRRRVTTAAIFGGLAPDVSLYLMSAWSIMILGVSPDVVFRVYYYSSTWQQVFAVDNSFIIWGMGLGFALWVRRPAVIAFSGAGLLHLALDFPLHNHDARMHFWPLSDWVFVSPFSYWDSRFHANIVGPMELTLALVLSGFLLARFKGFRSRALVCFGALTEISVGGFFSRLF